MPKTVLQVVEVDRVEDLRNLPENIKKAEVSGVISGVIYKRHRSYDGGTYWAAENEKIPESAIIYEDVIIGPGVKLSAHIEIGMGSTIGAGTKIGPGSVIGKGVNIGENCDIGKKVVIGDDAEIKDHVIIEKGSRIGEGAYVGENAKIKKESKIGDRAYIHSDKSVKGVVGEGDIVEEDYNTTDSEQEEEKHLKEEFEEDFLILRKR